MSSAILYLAIVAIWAMVLVPRWLRHPHPAQHGTEIRDEDTLPGSQPASTAAAFQEAGRAQAGAGQFAEPGAAPAPAGQVTPAPHPRAGPASPPAPARTATSPAERRARILRARRRTLFTLLLLTAGAAVLAAAQLAAWWVAAPPGMMLGGFLLLLREAARIDAQRAAPASTGWETATEGGAARTAGAAESGRVAAASGSQEATQEAEAEAAAGPGAEIIDISARISDQLYDQYTDAEARAIGD